MNHNAIETVLGGVVLLVAAVFLFIALGASSMHKVSGYDVTADFSKIDGIVPGLDVRISGVKVGAVSKTELDPKTYLAKVTMTINDTYQLPTDTVAKVSSEGLLGGKYMGLEPGAEDAMIKPGGHIEYTQASVNLEELIGKFIFSGADNKDKKPGAAAAPAPAAMGGATPDAAASPAPTANSNAPAAKPDPFSANY